MEQHDHALARAVAKAHTMSDSDSSDSESNSSPLFKSRGSQDLFDSSLEELVHKPTSSLKNNNTPVRERTIQKDLSSSSKTSATNCNEYSKLEDTTFDEKRKKSVCKYGSKCFRKNPSHLKEFFHPGNRSHPASPRNVPELEKKRKRDNEKTIAEKKKIKDKDKTLKDVFEEFQPFSFFLTKVAGISERFNNSGAFSLKDILSPCMGELKESCHFNFCFDMPWLMSQYSQHDRKLPVLLVHGNQNRDELDMKAEAAEFTNISLCRARLDIPYGTHHTKMMLLLYSNGLRVVIHTANLIANDWHQKTQGMWVSPVFPPLSEGSGFGDSPTGFKVDLLQYLAAYRAPRLAHWEKRIKAHDMSAANVHIIGSVPGRHTLNNKSNWGHLKLKKVLSERGPTEGLVKNWPLVAQFSSIGSLGATKDDWLLGEFGATLSTCKQTLTSALPQSKCHLIYPSVNNIRLSLEGYNGGGCVPYSIKTASKQVWLTQFFNQWQSEGRGRSRGVPHIKSYSRFSPDGTEASWFMLTSANLSKAAWGAFEKQKSQLMIRSYELGVLFLPQYFGLKDSFPVTNDARLVASTDRPIFPLPYDLPPVTYVKGDRPWFIDVPCMDQPDTFGTMWCPPL